MLMQVKKATFQRKEVVERVELKIMGYIRCMTVCTTGSISYISTVSTSRRVSG